MPFKTVRFILSFSDAKKKLRILRYLFNFIMRFLTQLRQLKIALLLIIEMHDS